MEISQEEGRSADWLEENFFSHIPKDAFFSEIQGKKCAQALIDPSALANLPTWPQINSFLSNHRLTTPRIRMSLQGATDADLRIFSERRSLRGEPILDILPEQVYSNLRNGATLVLDSIDLALPSVGIVGSSITKHFLVKAQANAYITFGKERGFGLHWDDHDVFVVQLHGTKTWDIYGATRESPMHSDFHNEHRPPANIVESIHLKPRSVLYVPRGCWHDVIGTGEPTFHLTFGVTAATGIDFLEWLKEKARAKPFFREDMPLNQSEKGAAYSESFVKALAELASSNDSMAFAEELRRSLRPYPKFSFPFGVNSLVKLAGSNRLLMVPQTYNIQFSSNRMFVEANNRVWELPSGLKALLDALSREGSISVDASWNTVEKFFKGQTFDSWVVFLDSLIAQGLFYVESDISPATT